MDLKYKEDCIREAYEAIWTLKNTVGDDLTAEVIVRAFGNNEVLNLNLTADEMKDLEEPKF